MIDGKVLATLPAGGDAVEVWGVWIPRRADNVSFTVELSAIYEAKFAVDLWEKDYDEVGDGSDAGIGTAFGNRPERVSFTKLGAKELVRVKLTLEPGSGLGHDDVGLVLFRFLEPVWFESVKG